MDVEIRKLTPELLEDYLYFFENVAHTDNKEWDRCYCLAYCSDNNLDKDFSSPEVRREYAIKYVSEGILQGYLAYFENKVVGWCNANRKDDCRKCGGWRYIPGNNENISSELNIKSVFCFTVAPEMRKKGIAEQLLLRVCEDAAKEGYDCVEGYPHKGETDQYYSYVGPLGLYNKLGFEVCYETEWKYLMRKHLSQE